MAYRTEELATQAGPAPLVTHVARTHVRLLPHEHIQPLHPRLEAAIAVSKPRRRASRPRLPKSESFYPASLAALRWPCPRLPASLRRSFGGPSILTVPGAGYTR